MEKKLVPGRADSDEKKRDMIDRLFSAWTKVPDLRFGQFLVNTTGTIDIFSLEDEFLVRCAEQFVEGE